MSNVLIIGNGQTPVTKGQDRSGHRMACEAIELALADAEIERGAVSALYVGNMMAGILEHQHQLAALCAGVSNLNGVEAFTVEASCGSGAAALRTGFMAVSGGFHEVAVVCGVERMSHTPREETTRALATAADWEREGSRGESFLSLNARLMSRYMQTYRLQSEDFAPFAITAHSNGLKNANALLHMPLDVEGYLESKMLVEPLRLMDSPPICDGAAAVILANEHIAAALQANSRTRVEIRASTVSTDSVSIDNRVEKLQLPAAEQSSQRAYRKAGVSSGDIDFFELHDAFTVITALSLEAAGFADPGEAVYLGKDGTLALDGRLPISTMGGLKSRGHPVGATGIYQISEAVQQLTGVAGENQIANPEIAMTQNIGGTGATVVTHILAAV